MGNLTKFLVFYSIVTFFLDFANRKLFDGALHRKVSQFGKQTKYHV